MRYHIAVCIFLLQLSPLFAYSRLDLNGDKWTLSEESKGTKLQGKVPGTPYTALLDQGKIKDPLYRDNDVQLAWIGKTNWTYAIDFTATADQANAKQATLVCEGLDTFATVSLNGKVVGKADNMFIRWEFNITGILQQGTNTLTVNFTSAVWAAQDKVRLSSYPIPPDCPPAAQHGECHVNQIRKTQGSFGSTWGPSFPTQGIWKPIYIETFDSAILSGLSAVVSKVNGAWQVEVDVDFDVMKGSVVQGQFQSTIKDLDVTYFQAIKVTFEQRKQKFVMPVPQETKVSLWWPNGHGAQPLFQLKAQFVAKGESTTKFVKIGFRTVELIQEPVTSDSGADKGLTFYFKVNDVPIFLKGSNWIPADSFQERITREHLQFLLFSATNVSINALRVWGGGVYESDDFYDLCDELGLLVWQDFTFNSALYPTYPGFLKSVSREVYQQVRRLKYHPSILVWAGNNQNELALREDWFHVKGNYSRYYKDYVALYVNTLKAVVTGEDPTRAYLTSSPSNGDQTVKEGYVAKNPNSELYGDIHYFPHSGDDQWNCSNFRIPRMVTQHGIQSWCNFPSLADVFDSKDFNVKSKMVEHRQHSPEGNAQLMKDVALHLQLPQSTDPQDYFEEFIYLSQINQAMALRAQIQHYKRHQAGVLADGRGLTMGAFNLQLNDIWQGPSWSSIDYEGRWKMVHYYSKNLFQKYLVSAYQSDNDTLNVFFTVDDIPAVQDAASTSESKFAGRRQSEGQKLSQPFVGSLTYEMHSYDKFRWCMKTYEPFELKTTSQLVDSTSIKRMLKNMFCRGPEYCFLKITATQGLHMDILATSWFMFSDPKDAVIEKTDIKISSVTQRDAQVFDIKVETYYPALFVWLSAGDILGHFSDNGFHMFEVFGQVQFFSREPTTLQDLKYQLRVRSLVNKPTQDSFEKRGGVRSDVLH